MLLGMACVVSMNPYDLLCRKHCIAPAVLLMCWAHTCLSFVYGRDPSWTMLRQVQNMSAKLLPDEASAAAQDDVTGQQQPPPPLHKLSSIPKAHQRHTVLKRFVDCKLCYPSHLKQYRRCDLES